MKRRYRPVVFPSVSEKPAKVPPARVVRIIESQLSLDQDDLFRLLGHFDIAEEALHDAFRTFFAQILPGGLAVAGVDHPVVRITPRPSR